MQTIESADSKITQITLPDIHTYLSTRSKPSSLALLVSEILYFRINVSLTHRDIVLLNKHFQYFTLSFGLTDPYFDICNGI